MKKDSMKNYLKFGILLLAIPLLLLNCEKEEIIPLHQMKLKTVSKQKVKEILAAYIKKNKETSKKGSNAFSFTPLYETLKQKELNFTEALLTNLKIESNIELLSTTRLFFIEVNGKVIKAIKTERVKNYYENEKIKEGTIYYHNLKGEFLLAHKIKDGVVKERLYKKINTQQASFFSILLYQSDCSGGIDEVSVDDLEGGCLNAAHVYGPGESMQDFLSVYDNSGKPIIPNERVVGSSSGGGGSSAQPLNTDPITGECKEGYVKNIFGECVKPEDPCKHINLQIQNPRYTTQAEELKRKTGLRKETGYKQNKDGTQVALNDTNNGHSLEIPIDRNTVGYMHTHINDFLNGKIDKTTGEPLMDKPIKIFSPADVIKFLQMVKNSKYNGVPTHLVYGTVIASIGNYTLRFTGNIDDITGLGTAKSYKSDYELSIEKKGRERGFLHFLKDKIGINGINLYRIRDNGDIEKKTLKDNGRVDTNDCE